ncbi:MAG: cobalt transporter CbiM [Proteobacteria bacterium]|nr:cobalt transporter CbiM [Pseudomonadota bacterium]
MHIPDGYLGPKTCVVFYAAMLPLWYVASRKLATTLKQKELPLLSLGAAFAFVIMMFNVPLPGGASGHMAGAVVVAIVLGPWASVAALTLVLALQATLFGDGGITTLGANVFSIAVVMSFVGHYVYTALVGIDAKTGAKEATGTRRAVAAAVAAFLGVNASALCTAFALGIQPALSGTAPALYAPFALGVTLPAIGIPHLLFIGPIEALGTAVVVTYLYRSGVQFSGTDPKVAVSRIRPLWFALAALVLLVPLGLFATAAPWGEWNTAEVTAMIGYLPSGMERMSGYWSALMPGYTLPGLGSTLGYIAAAAVGSATVLLSLYTINRLYRSAFSPSR